MRPLRQAGPVVGDGKGREPARGGGSGHFGDGAVGVAAGHGMGVQVNKDIHADSIAKSGAARELV